MPATTKQPAAVMVPTADLRPWVKNPRKNDHVVRSVADSIQRFGFANPILARAEDGRVIAGHTRLKAAILLGLEEVPVRYMDLTNEQADALALADNKLGELATWDDAALAEVLAGLDSGAKGLGWTDDELADILRAAQPEPMGDPDDAPEVQADAVSVAGEVYELGPHRLVCGDCRGASVGSYDAVVTDPPYGVAFQSRSRSLAPIAGDDSTNLYHDVKVMIGQSRLAFGLVFASGGTSPTALAESIEALQPAHVLVWAKAFPGMGSGWRGAWEAILAVGSLKPADKDVSDVFTGYQAGPYMIARDKFAAAHPTSKPTALMKDLMRVLPVGCKVFDPFSGSGSTLIACAMTDRECVGVELDPRYCDVIRRRWTKWARDNGQDPGPGALD